MKKYFVVAVLVLQLIDPAFSQTKPKSKTKEPMSKQKETVPTQKEMEEMMKEAQKQLDNLDPEAKKMMDSMGFKMPTFNNIPQVTDAQLQEAYDNDNRIVPTKDVARIGSISKTALTTPTLAAFITEAHNSVGKQLKPASKTKGDEIYRVVTTEYKSARATGNTAVTLWMLGKVEIALHVMGKACIDDPVDIDNLNNYASMLSMSGAEQLAIPLLNYVDKLFPNNSTVLNNLGQAWFGLGDIDKASVHLDKVIKLYAYHPQANYTKSLIEESKGNTTAALTAARQSIKRSYTQKKEDRLGHLDSKLTANDLDWNLPMPQDPLGLEKFKWPAYPNNVSESEALEKEWTKFKEMCRQELNELTAKQRKAEEAMLAGTQRRMNQLMKASQQGLLVNPMPPFAPKAAIKLRYLVDGKDGHLAVNYQKKIEALTKAAMDVAALEEKLETQIGAVNTKYEDLFGEGKSNPFEAACNDENNVSNNFLATSNSILQQASTDYLNFLRRKLNDETYYNQYLQWPDEFELTKINAKIMWLSSISGQKVMFRNKSKWCQPSTPGPEKKLQLASFDDTHCQYHSTFTTPVGTIRMDCSKWTTELDLKVVKLGLKQDMDKETFGDQFVGCTVEVGVGAGFGVKNGPIKAEASIGGGIGLEFDRNGLSDVVLKTSAGISAGTDIISGGSKAGVGVSDLSVDVGVSGQISLISGQSSAESTGILAGVFKR